MNSYEKNTVKKKNIVITKVVKEIAPAVITKLESVGKYYSKELLESFGAVQGIVSNNPVIGFPMHTGDFHCICYTTYPEEPRFLNAAAKAKDLEMGLLGNPEKIKDEEKLYLAEGIWDLLTLTKMGFPSLGLPGVNHFEKEWAEKFMKDKKVYICFDNDGPGKEYAAKYVNYITRWAKEVRILEFPEKLPGIIK